MRSQTDPQEPEDDWGEWLLAEIEPFIGFEYRTHNRLLLTERRCRWCKGEVRRGAISCRKEECRAFNLLHMGVGGT